MGEVPLLQPPEPSLTHLLLLRHYSQAQSCVVQRSMGLAYEPSSDPLHISVEYVTYPRALALGH